MSKEYIVFWKDSPGQQVNTVVDAGNQPVLRGVEYVETNCITVLTSEDGVLSALESADGEKYAVTPDLARATLGWDV